MFGEVMTRDGISDGIVNKSVGTLVNILNVDTLDVLRRESIN
jgi:hypothetical protein